MSPIPKTRNPAIRRFCQLVLTINSLGTLFAVMASHSGPRAPRTGAPPAMRRLRPLLVGHRHLTAGYMTLPTPMHHTATPGPALEAAAVIARDRQSLWCNDPTLIGCLMSPPGPHPGSRRSLPWHTACSTSSPLLTSSPPAGLPLRRCQKITVSGNRHLPMAVLSSV
jgi:hypothetical protein